MHKFEKNLTLKKKVLITLDRLKYPNCGLGRYSADFGGTLLGITSDTLSFSFLLPKRGFAPIESVALGKTIKLNILNKTCGFYQKRFDLVHITHQLPNFKLNSKVKKVITIHDLNHLITKDIKRAEEYINRIQDNVNKSDGIIFISQFTYDFCKSHLNLPSDKLYTVIHNGINIPAVEADKPIGFGIPTRYLFTIGQIQPKKNFHVLIPFLAQLPSDYELIIAGEHSNKEYVDDILKAAGTHNLDKRVHLVGSVTEAEKRFLYENCEAFVFPSIAEGFGMPVIEAMRFKKPVFSSDKTSLAEIGGDYAFFWNDFAVDSMKKVFEDGMIKADDIHLEMAYDYSLQFSWEQNVKKHLEFYTKILGK